MKTRLCLLLAALLCLLTLPASALYVPQSTSKLPDMLSMPAYPEIVRVQNAGDAITITLREPLPEDALVVAMGRDAQHLRYVTLAVPGDNSTCTAAGLPLGGEWTGFDIDWKSSGMNALAHYNAAGGLETVTRYDHQFNEYIFDNDGYLREFAYADDTVRVRFNTRGVMTSYGYKPFRNMLVWFSPEGSVVCAEYDEGDGGIAADWEPGYGWYVDSINGREKLALDVTSPWNALPLLPADAPAEKAEVTHYPNNTIMVCGLTLQEADKSLPDKWYNVLPIDLKQEGRQVYRLMISNMFLIGEAYVDVWGDEVTVNVSLLDHGAVRPLSWYGRWFTHLGEITAASIEAETNGFSFGEPVSISQELAGADTALLFIRGKASYYQPFRDGTGLTRYWRNQTEWKEFRQGLQELMPRVEK